MAVQISGNDITVPRDGSFTRNVTIGGTLTYEDVTNIDSVGLVTARTGIEIGARPGVAASISVDGNMIVSGVTTFTPGGSEIVRINSGGLLLYNDLSFFGASTHAYWDHSSSSFALSDNTKLKFGSGSDLQIYHDGSGSYIEDSGTGQLSIESDVTNILNAAGNEYCARFIEDGAVKLYHNGTEKLETSSTGVSVTGAAAITGAATLGNGSGLNFGDTGARIIGETGASGYLRFDTNGGEKVRINSSGQFGIGSGSNTNKPLHIYTGSSDAEIRLQTNSGTEQNSYISLRNSGGAVDIYSVNSAINLHPANTKRFEALANGNVEITDGDLVIGTSGHGIDFSATTDGTGTGSTSEVLDDYEEGTWNPQIGGSTTAGSYSRTGEGYYIKVGKQVTAWLNCTGSVSGASGSTRITGLPFTAASNSASNGYTAVYSAGSAQYWAGFGNADILGALIVVSSTYIYFHTDNGSSTGANNAIQNGGHNAHVHVSYFTN